MWLWSDVRYAFRQLRKNPGFTILALVTLALCIGVNTAIFSVLDAVLFRAAPFPQADRLALVETVWRGRGGEDVDTSQTGALYEAVRDRAAALDCAAWSLAGGANFASGGHSEYIQQQRVSAGYFRVMGIPLLAGREFAREEDVPGGARVAVLNWSFWQRQFHGDSGILGKAIDLKGEPYTVVGIAPRAYPTYAPVDVWTPLRPSRRGEGSGSNYGVMARLKAGVSWPAANEQLRALSRALAADASFPREGPAHFEERVVPMNTGMLDETRRELLVTWGAVLMVLLIGCVNVAGLLLARASAREREIATRMALGGNRLAVVRQLLIESVLLAAGGGVIGVGIGGYTLDWLKQLGADKYQLWRPIELDFRVMAAMMGAAVATSLVFGLAPALAMTRLDIRGVLAEAGRGVAGPRRRGARQMLVAAEVALSLVLLVGAGLMLRTLAYLNGLNPGFDTRNVIAAEASLQDARYNELDACERLYRESLARIRRIPGVESAAVALTLPYERPLNNGMRVVDGDDREMHTVEMVYVTPDYLDTMRIPLAAGRGLRESDRADAPGVVVVSRSFVEKYLRGKNALGHHVSLGSKPREIVGVAGDVQQHSGISAGSPVAVEPTIYIPVAQLNSGFMQLVHTWFSPKWAIRTSGPLPGLPAEVRAAMAEVDPLLPIARFRTVDELAGLNTKGEQYLAALFTMLAALAVLLAAVGLYGLISQSVAQRRHELGIRMALGATAGQTIAGVMRPGLVLAGAGVAAGLGMALAAARLMKSLVFGVRENDPATLAATAAVLLIVAAGASLLPALRILKMDPAETLRSE
ncbi:MAG: ABC transporter permease [Acidobacteria bacterium]|nr:ABC transporter permease [Acidobacteriota bacterium]